MPNSLDKSLQDKEDLDRFSKYFVYKVVQIIVQSRLGEKIRCSSRLSTHTADWFNLCIEDHPEIYKNTTIALGSNFLPNPPLLVEISLKPVDDSEALAIELWNLHFNEMDIENNVRILFTVYNRMSMLLKSLISVTRVVPAYKYSRMKGNDYQILYAVRSGDPDYNRLGRECKIIKLGTIGTPFGSFCLDFGYRTKMALSIESRPMNPVFMKSNHYSVDDDGMTSGIDVNDPYRPIPLPRIPAFSDPASILMEEVDPLDIPFGSLLRRNSAGPTPVAVQRTKWNPKDEDSAQLIIEEEEVSSSTSGSDGATASSSGRFELVTLAVAGGGRGPTNTACKPIPFAPLPDPASDPASFFSTLQHSPELDSFETTTTQFVSEIDQQLDRFEENLDVFDDFVKNLCLEE